MEAEKYYVLYAGVSYEPGSLVGIFSAKELAEEYIKSGNTIGGDYYELFECEVNKPFRSYREEQAAIRTFG